MHVFENESQSELPYYGARLKKGIRHYARLAQKLRPVVVVLILCTALPLS